MILKFPLETTSLKNPETLFEQEVLNFIKEFQSEEIFVDVQTSGSTGSPKIFSIEKEKMRFSAKMTCEFLNLEEGNRALLCLPVQYISGKMMVVRSLVKNLQLIVSSPSISPLIQLDSKIDFCAMTPLQVENSLDKIHLIKKLIIGGAAVSEKLKSKIFNRLGNDSSTSIYETYGMSETLSHIALKQVYPQSEDYFTSFTGVNISKDARGCLVIQAPELTSEVLITNDLVDIKENNRFQFLGRVDNVINSGGAKIFPERLEALAKKVIENEIVFIGIKDDVLGEKLIAVVESDDDEQLKSLILNLDFEKKFHQPKEIIFLPELPRTPNGKISRLELKKLISK